MIRGVAGCLETIGIAVFALILGIFGASTLMRHVEDEAPTNADPGSRDTAPPVPRARIRVEVRNGAGVPGAAERVTELLRRRGFDVVDFGNADRFDYPRTTVLDRVGNPRYAREVAATLQGVPIEPDLDAKLYLDVTVVLGHDFEDIVERAESGGGKESEGWRTRLRRQIDRIPWP